MSRRPVAVGLNDNWGNLATDVPAVIHEVGPLVMGVQEAYRQDYRKLLSKQYGVQQRLSNDATAGVCCIWDRNRVHRIRWKHAGHSHPSEVGHGWHALCKAHDTRMRGVAWVDLQFHTGMRRPGLPQEFRLAAAHRPPERDRGSWPEFDRKLEHFLRVSPLPVLVLMDSNEHHGPSELLHAVGEKYHWAGVGIDGGLSALPTNQVKALPRLTSDHKAVVIGLGPSH